MKFNLELLRKLFQRSDNTRTQSANVTGDNNIVNQVFIGSIDGNDTQRKLLSQPLLAETTQPLISPHDFDGENTDEIKRIVEIRRIADKGNGHAALELLDTLRSDPRYSSGHNAFRLRFNIGIIQQNMGEFEQASASLRDAHSYSSDEYKAQAGLAFAELIDKQYEKALELAQDTLAHDGDHQSLAVCVLFQAAKNLKREVFDVKPELFAEGDAAAAYLEYIREIKPEEFKEALKSIYKKNKSNEAIATLWAYSVIDDMKGNQAFLLGAKMPDGFEEQLVEAASTLKNDLAKNLKRLPPNKQFIPSQANNAAFALRLSGDVMEAARLLDNTLESFPELIDDLAELRAVLFLQEKKDNEAFELIKDLKSCHDLQILASEIEARMGKNADAIVRINEVIGANLPSELEKQALSTKARIGINSLSRTVADEALEEITSKYPNSSEKILLQSAYDRAFVLKLEHEEIEQLPITVEDKPQELQRLLKSLSEIEDWSFVEILRAAEELLALGEYRACTELLKGRVSFRKESPALEVLCDACLRGHLGSLAAEISASFSKELKNSVFGWRFDANVASLTGEITKAVPLTRKLYDRNPNSLSALTWFVESLLRTNNKNRILRLIKDIEDDSLTGTLEERCEFVKLLVFCSEIERARNYAYRLFCENQNDHRTWMALSASVLARGRPPETDDSFDQKDINIDATFEIAKPNGEIEVFTIEDEVDLFPLRSGNIPKDHPVAEATFGKRAGEVFEWPIGKHGGDAKIISVKHKALAAFHFVLKRFEEQFPNASGFTSIPVEVDHEDGLNEMMVILKQRSDYSKSRASDYHKGSYPLYILAFHLGIDPIDAFLGLKPECGYSLKVSSCTTESQNAAVQAFETACSSGLIADAITCYIIRRLELEDIIKEEFGSIGITQTTLDIFAQRLQDAESSSFFDDEDGGKKTGSIAERDGRIVLTEHTKDEIDDKINLLRSDLDWLQSECTVIKSAAKVDPDDAILRFRREQGGRFFDDLFAADGSDRILITEDFHLRQWAENFFNIKASWIQELLHHLEAKGKLSKQSVVRLSIYLIQIGEEALSTNNARLLAAAEMLSKGEITEQDFTIYSSLLGQPGADMQSHLMVALLAIDGLWSIHSLHSVREKSTGIILRNLTRLQGTQTLSLLDTVQKFTRNKNANFYITAWRRGHFLMGNKTTD